MAELNANEKSTKKVRSKKLTAKVDLTAMVDLAFLLITFFMLTTTLAEEKSMDLYLPDNGKETMPVDENRTMTVLIGNNNKVRCFMGKHLSEAREFDLNSREFRHEIATRKREVDQYSAAKGAPEKRLIVLIKPGTKSDYGNFIDVLDEIIISKVPNYIIADVTPEEAKLLH